MSSETKQLCSGTVRRIVGRWRAAAVACAAAALMAILPCTDAKAQGGLANLPAILPVMGCADVAGLNLTGATDAPVTIQSATVVTPGASGAAGAPGSSGAPGASTATAPYCDVRGTIAPAVMFELRLPTQGWTQRYLQAGCGGLCGSITISPAMASTCAPVTNGQIAIAATDMGHEGQQDGSWGANNPQARIDFAYRAEHVTSQVAKAIVTQFYGQPPRYAYFDGCSDGGREALMEAQRYPDDFDGILAGAPANDLVVQNTFHHGWNVLANLDASGNPILLAGKLPLIHQAVVAACDALDGVADGIIDDPRRCDFDPTTLLCAPGQDPSTCLSAAEAAVVQRLHDGPTDANGNRLEQYIAHEWGSELDWTLFVPAAAGQVTFSQQIALSFLQYLAFYNYAIPSYQITDLQFTVPYFYQTVETSHFWAATDPNLSAFAGRGGKLILYHGWADQHITPQVTLQYYHDMQALMGADTVARFAALYLFSGMAHCGGGLGPNVFDALTPVMAWVESGTMPGAIIASIVDQTSGAVTRTRPVFPYPQVARYTGTGSTDTAANFVAYTPQTEPPVDDAWIGAPLYSSGYESQCGVLGSKMACQGGLPYPWEPTQNGPDWALSQP